MDTAKIVYDFNGKQRIQLGTFTHGQIKRDRTELDRCHMYEEYGTASKKKQIMAAETCSMTYIGKNYDDNNNDSCQSNTTYLGAFCPKTGKMEVFEVDMFTFRPHLPEFDEDQKDDTNKTSDKMSYMEQQELLTTVFGSKRAKLVTEARKKTKVGEESLKTVLKSTVLEGQAAAIATQQKLEDLMSSEDVLMFYLPPYDKDADKPEDIFNISNIITEQEMIDLLGPAQELFDCNIKTVTDWRKEQKYPLLILKHLENLPSTEDRRWENCKCLMYLHYMLTFIKMSTPTITNKKEIFPEEWPPSVKARLLEQFTGPPPIDASFSQKVKYRRSFSKKHQNKLLTYILILGLILDKYTLKVQNLIKDCNMGLRRILEQARIIGLKTQNTKNIEQTTIKLEAPLTFNPTGRIKQKKK